jgi:hypothetical protein
MVLHYVCTRFDIASYLTQALRSICGLIASTSNVLFPSKMIGFEAFLTLENQQLSSQPTTDISSSHILKSRLVINSGGKMHIQVNTYFSKAISIVSNAIKPILAQSIATGVSQLITNTGELSSTGTNKDPLSNVMNSLSSSILSLFGQETSLIDPMIVASLRVICDQDDGSSVCGSIAKSFYPSSSSSSSSSSNNDFSYNSHIVIASSTSSTMNPSKESPRNLQNIPKHTLTVSPLGLIFDTSGMIIANVDSLLQVEGSGKNVFLDTAIANALKIVRDSNYTLSAKLDTSTIIDPDWYRYTYNNSTSRYIYDNSTRSENQMRIISSTTCGTVNLFLRGKQRIGQTVTVGVNAQVNATNVYNCIEYLLKEYNIIPPVSSEKRDLFVTSSTLAKNLTLGGLVQLRLTTTEINDVNNLLGWLSAPISLNNHLWAVSTSTMPQPSFSKNINAGSESIEASLTLSEAVYQLPRFEYRSELSGATITNLPSYSQESMCTDVREFNNAKKGAYMHNVAFAGCDRGDGIPSRDKTLAPCLGASGSSDILNLLNLIFPDFVQKSSGSSSRNSFGQVDLNFKESNYPWGATGNIESLPLFLNYVNINSYEVSGCSSVINTTSRVSSLLSTSSSSSLLTSGKIITLRINTARSILSSIISQTKRSLPLPSNKCIGVLQSSFETQCGGEFLLGILRMFSPIIDDFYNTFLSAKSNPVGTIQSSWQFFLRYTWPQLSQSESSTVSLIGEKYLDTIVSGFRKLFINLPVQFINSLKASWGSVYAEVFILDINKNESVAWVNATTLNGGSVESGSVNSTRISVLDISCKLFSSGSKPAPLWTRLSGIIGGTNTSISLGSPLFASLHLGYLLIWFDQIASRLPTEKFLTDPTQIRLYKDTAISTILIKAIDYLSGSYTNNITCAKIVPSVSATPTVTPSQSVQPSASKSAPPRTSLSPSPSSSIIPAINTDGSALSQTETIIIIASSVVAGVIIIVAIGGFIFVRYCLGGRGNINKGKDISKKDEQNPFNSVKPQTDYGTTTIKTDTIAEDWHVNPKKDSSPVKLYI